MSDRRRLEESWARTESFLRRALVLLPTNPVESVEGGRVEAFHMWMDHNELELALDELMGLGANNSVPREFWSELRGAAAEMELQEHVAEIDQKLAGHRS